MQSIKNFKIIIISLIICISSQNANSTEECFEGTSRANRTLRHLQIQIDKIEEQIQNPTNKIQQNKTTQYKYQNLKVLKQIGICKDCRAVISLFLALSRILYESDLLQA